MKRGMKLVQAAKQQCLHGTGGMLGKQGEMGKKTQCSVKAWAHFKSCRNYAYGGCVLFFLKKAIPKIYYLSVFLFLKIETSKQLEE